MMPFTRLCIFAAFTISMASAASLTVINPNFDSVGVQCGSGYAYQSYEGGTCSPGFEQQNFNGSIGIGWIFATYPAGSAADGISKPNTSFEPPPFTGVPFSQAAYLQGATSVIDQTIPGFVPGGQYTLSFYLGSRYYSGSYDGNQTVEVMIDSQVIGTWSLVSYTPFTLETVNFTVATGGSHTLTFAGTATGDHTAFFSGVSIQTANNLTLSHSAGFPGVTIDVSAAGFAPSETVALVGYSSAAPAVIGVGEADTSGNVTIAARIPQTPLGAYGMLAYGESSKKVVSGIIGVVPNIVIAPTTVAIGSTISVKGDGFAADEPVYIVLLNPTTLLESSTTSVIGSFSHASVTIPSGTSAGVSTVAVVGQRSGASASVQITVE
jgi:hypothetical protein